MEVWELKIFLQESIMWETCEKKLDLCNKQVHPNIQPWQTATFTAVSVSIVLLALTIFFGVT